MKSLMEPLPISELIAFDTTSQRQEQSPTKDFQRRAMKSPQERAICSMAARSILPVPSTGKA